VFKPIHKIHQRRRTLLCRHTGPRVRPFAGPRTGSGRCDGQNWFLVFAGKTRREAVVGRRDGKRVYYRLAGDDAVVGLLSALSRVGERNSAEIARVMASYFRARDEFEPVTHDELLDRLRAGSAAVLDVRPEDEFANGRLPKALNIPLAQLERRLAELSQDQEIIAYVTARGASSLSRPSRCSVSAATGRGGSRMDFPNGKRPGCQPCPNKLLESKRVRVRVHCYHDKSEVKRFDRAGPHLRQPYGFPSTPAGRSAAPSVMVAA
jgi:hypothetical protein